MTDPRVGFIGLGQIGAPIATRLCEWRGGLIVFDVAHDAMAPFAERGATLAADVAEVGATADVIEVMVRDDQQVRDVVEALLPATEPGAVIAVHSTIRPTTAEELAAVCAAHQVRFLDVPVSGGFVGAIEGTLAAMVGGPRDAYELVKEPFSCWATLTVHTGDAGSATRMKLARNMAQFAAYAAALEAMRLAEAAGVDVRQLARVVRHGDGVTGGPCSIMVRDTAAPLAPDDPFLPIFRHTRDLGEKDLALALELAEALGTDVPFGRLTLEELGRNLGLPTEG
ncbi:MAG: NAD(P)-dependent oxidoreductase [Actinomycetota bacterium]|nr:NAD(P)-dependent oxidoreductase [Actinomycetota bacterium]